jgi:hypothetical protein
VHAQQIIATHPDVRGLTNTALIRCIEACFDCSQTCTSCADACLAEPDVRDLVQCIRTCLDCADVCLTTGLVSSRRTGSNEGLVSTMLQSCETACRLCAEECERHAERMAHCRICAETCRRCEVACRDAGLELRRAIQ